MTTFARQASVLKVTQELALEGFLHFLRVHEGKAKDYPDYVEARKAASATLALLARMEAVHGHEHVRAWLERASARAEGTVDNGGNHDAASA